MVYRMFLLAALAVVGCRQSVPPAADPARAKAALQTALDAWKNGETTESLRARKPAIYFNEPSCTSDNRLVDYAIESEERNGFNWRCVVMLTVQSGGGQPKQRKVKYLIDTDPAVVIVQDP